jgi:hypothetical protein
MAAADDRERLSTGGSVGAMAVIVYLDETGSPLLSKIDPLYPVFAAMMCVIDIEEYTERLCPAMKRLKFEFFGHDATVFHSYDIRKSAGEFSILLDTSVRERFLPCISAIMRDHSYQLIGVAIRKEEHRAKYGDKAFEPYDFALEMALERLAYLLHGLGQKEVHIIAEKRGKVEDNALRSAFDVFTGFGNYFVPASEVQALKWHLRFVAKDANIIGLQVADLAASPFGARVAKHGPGFRYADPPDQAWEIVRSKEYPGGRRPSGFVIKGFKVFP